MNDNYYEWRRKENIQKFEIPDLNQYFYDLMNIEHSFSGRMDTPLANTFIMESVQLIVNSICLFEMGYFDNAYYSLREAIEISTTIVYLADMPEDDRKEKMESWKNTTQFPMQSQMLQQLYQHGLVISDMKEKMPDFFNEVKQLSKKINKYVHKQGLKNFYVSRNHPINSKNSNEVFINNYTYFLKKTIGIVSIMRLAIDPYPVLLMDEEILLRCFDSLTEPYSTDFVEKYIDVQTLEDYKKTDIYINHYNGHIENEKKNYAVFDIMKHNIIDTTKKEEIFSKIHLLDKINQTATYLAFTSKKATKIYAYGGFYMFFTDRKTNRKALSWSGLDFQNFENSNEKYNQKYDEAFISVFEFIIDGKKEAFFIEHNDKLNEDDINEINKIEIK